jgi:PIN like domain
MAEFRDPRRVGVARMPELDAVRFFVDEDLAGVGIGLMCLRSDVVVGGQPPARDLVPPLDCDWIPVVADRGWIAITNDKHVRTRYDEAQLAIDHELRCVHLAPGGRDPVRWDFVRLLLRYWDSVEDLLGETGPVWLALRPSGPHRMDYRPGEPPRLPSA